MLNNRYSIRPAEEEDFEVIAHFPQNDEELYYMFPKAVYPLTAEQLIEAKRQRFEATVITCYNEVVGYANFYEAMHGKYCSIGNLIVHPQFRSQGVATYLIASMERLAQEQYHAKEVHISCFDTNTKGLLLYSKLGYKSYDIERRTKYNGEPTALIKMKKVL